MFALAALVGAMLPMPPQASGIVWTLGLFILGMAHGAYDLSALRRAERHARHPRLVRHGLQYVLVMAGCLAGFLAAPSALLAAFLILAAHHFGTADAVFTRFRTVRSFADNGIGLAFGLVVVAAPLAFQPVEASKPFASLAQLARDSAWFDPGVVGVVAGVALAIGCAVTVAMIVFLAATGRRGDAIEQAAMLGSVVVLGAFSPPLLALGLYFLLIHASGHCATAVRPGVYIRRHALWNSIRVNRESVSLLLPSIAIVMITALMAMGSIAPDAIASSFLVFCVVATLPHHLLWLGAIGPPLRRFR